MKTSKMKSLRTKMLKSVLVVAVAALAGAASGHVCSRIKLRADARGHYIGPIRVSWNQAGTQAAARL